MSTPESKQADARRGRSLAWPLAMFGSVVVITIGLAAVLIAREFSPARAIEVGTRKGEEAIARGVAKWKSFNDTQIDEKEADFIDGLPFTRDDMRLVVQQVDLTQNLYAENTKTKWGVDLGTTRVLLSVPARLFYAVDLSGEKTVTFSYSSDDRVFRAVFPDPEVLAVEIYDDQTRELMDVGWARFKSQSGDELVKRLDKRKYNVIRSRGESEEMKVTVREEARPVLARFIALYLKQGDSWGSEQEGFERIEVYFAGEDTTQPAIEFSEQTLFLDGE